MNVQTCASSNMPANWDSIDWNRAAAYVKKLQMRIAKAHMDGKHGKVKSLQWTLTHSFFAKALAIKRVTENKGKKTPGVDQVLWTTKDQKFEAISTLKRHGYQPQPLRRTYVPKSNGKKRPLGIPTMTDRAMQTLYKMALEPIAETTADPNSYGFRIGRCTQDAAVQCTAILSQAYRPQWILEGDIKGCFDNISHEWIQENIPMDKEMLRKFLKCGYIETGTLFPTDSGTPQGGSISPTICNMVLDGLEKLLQQLNVRKQINGVREKPKINYVRYADDFIVTGNSRSILEDTVLPIVEAFMAERGLTLSKEKTVITNIHDGFDFLGFNVRKYRNGKFLIKPSKANTQKFLSKVRSIIRRNKAAPQELLIKMLNPVIRGWTNYHMHNASKQTFQRVDHEIWNCLWRWAKRRHPHKSGTWVATRYFHQIEDSFWNFAVPYGETKKEPKPSFLVLEKASDREIRRFTKIKATANPFNAEQERYFEERETQKMYHSMSGRKTMLYLYMTQKGVCPHCGEKLTVERGFQIHRTQNGERPFKVMIHFDCHDSIHARKSDMNRLSKEGLQEA